MILPERGTNRCKETMTEEQMTQREFTNVREEMAVGFSAVRREMSTKADKADLRETEERLLHAIKGIEVRKADFDG